ncbi:hypothetical protein FLM11_12295 [Vibrio cholerae]|nr:hypothetical protein [Vibrio cholerae]TQO98792.1 hypothetical protein FLM11_12295 [Vibrio cholerae]TQP40790.1 hypothetical protein FLM01_03650 [Vibrio cholerae]TQP81666.1 hypothetical protein FLL88_08930 [Vibrio cholerae]
MATDIPFLLEAAAVLATFVHPNHIVYLAHGDSLTCRLPATPSCLGIKLLLIEGASVRRLFASGVISMSAV